MDIQGKVALITGGAVRVGKAITLMLAQAGAHVVINYNSSAGPAQATLSEAQAAGVDALALQCDVSDFGAVESMVRQVHARFGGVDILVNAASLFGKIKVPSDDAAKDLATWHKVTRISIDGAYLRLQPAGACHVSPWWRRHRQHRRSIGVGPLAGLYSPRRR